MPGADATGIHIRRAEAADRRFVLGLVPELHAFGPPPWRDRARMQDRDEQVIRDALDGRSPDAVVFVATAGDERLGFIHLCEEEDYYGGPCGHIGDVVVAPAARGKGVGSALIAAGERWARERGYRLLTLNVFLDNEGARALYEEIGFRPETIRHVKEID